MKNFAKIMAVLLTLVMLLSAFASCKTGEGTGDGTTEGSKPSEEQTPTTPTTPNDTPAETPEGSEPEGSESESESKDESSSQNLIELLPPDMNLGRDMAMFIGTLYYDEWLADDNGDLVGTELYKRISRVEDNLGIELDYTAMDGTSGQRATIMDEVKKRQEATDPNLIVDLVSTYSQHAGSLTLEGRYQNIADNEYLNLDNPWWPKDLLINSTIDDKLYFVSGDISPTLIYETYAIFYNTTLIEQYNIENPIDLVNDYQWTLDKVITLTENIYDDLDKATNPGPSSGDFYAFNINDDAHIKALPFGMGIRVLVPDEDDGYVFSELYKGEKMDIIVDKMNAWITNNQGVKTYGEHGFGDYGVSFKENRCIFTVGNFAYASHYLQGVDISYGVVPCPLYNTDQTEYYSYYGNPTSFWGVPTNADVDDSCALLDALGGNAYVYISPALFEKALKLKYVPEEVDGLSKMFDIIRDGLVFDACMFYNAELGTAYTQFTEIASGKVSWSSTFTKFKVAAMNNKVKSIVSMLRELP